MREDWLKSELAMLPFQPAVLEAIRNRRILVTGATGLIGAYLIHVLMYLNERFHTCVSVTALCRSECKARELFGQYMDGNGLAVCIHDVTEPFRDGIDADFIIHAASPADPRSFSVMPVETMLSNILGTRNLLEEVWRCGHGRLLYLSTGEVYGELEGVSCKQEHMSGYVDPMDPRSCYPCSKRAGETLCSSYGSEFGVDSVVARLCYVFGPTITTANSRADAQFLRNAAAGEDIVMKSEGLQRRSYCYVGDAVTALLSILVLGKSGEAYNVACPDCVVSIREYAETLADIAGVSLQFQLPDSVEKKGYSRISHAVLSADKLLELGWKSCFSLREGLLRTYCFYKSRLEEQHVVRA